MGILLVFLIFLVYFLPGLTLTHLFKGRLRSDPFFIVFLSFLLTPFFYQFLAHSGQLTLLNWLALNAIFMIVFYLFGHRFGQQQLDLDKVFAKSGNENNNGKVWKWGIIVIASIFFTLVILGKLGLPLGFLPVGDDKPRLQKTAAIALSDELPLFYNFPLSEMTIYYFNNVPSGLMTKFSNNEIEVNISWFIHSIISTITMLWLIWLLARQLFTTYLERFVLFLVLTFGSGLEFFLAKIRGFSEPHLEWWTDWGPFPGKLHTQISAFFTLFFWVSQHLFAALLIIPLYFLLISTERKKITTQIFVGIILASLVGYSMFVFLTVIGVYLLFLLIRILTKQEKFRVVIRQNLVIGGVSLLLALPMLQLYLGAEKESYFLFYANAFYFLDNNLWYFKIINLLLTIPIFLFVEFGLLLLIMIGTGYLFIRKKWWKTEKLYWALFLLVPIWFVFFVKAADDNNISMRSMIPVQIALGVFTAYFFGWLQKKYQPQQKVVVAAVGLLLITILPTALYEASQRLFFNFRTVDPIYQLMDQQLPLNAVVLSLSKDDPDYISALAHRYTFKPLENFNVTDFEYVAFGKIKDLTFEKPSLESYRKLLSDRPDLRDKYRFYLLGDRFTEFPEGEAVLRSNERELQEFKE